MEKIEEYIELVNSAKTDKEPKLTKGTFFNTIVANHFNHMILTNDFIDLDKPLYFNSKELVEKGSVKCSLNKPTDLDNVFIIKRVPNNLDTLHTGFTDSISYYNESIYKHKGIVFSAIQLSEEKGLEAKYLIFDYNEFSTEEIELIISILKPEDLTTYLDIEKDKDLILNLKEVAYTFEKELKEAINFYSDFDKYKNNISSEEDLPEEIEGFPEEIITGFSKIGFNIVK